MYTINLFAKKTSKTVSLLMMRISTGKRKVDHVEIFIKEQMSWLPSDIQHQEKVRYEFIDVSTGISLPTAFWDAKLKTCKGSYTHLNGQLQYMIEQVEHFISHNTKLKANELKQGIKTHIIDYINKSDNKKEIQYKSNIPTGLTEYLRFKIIEWKKGANPKKQGTLKNYNKFINWIERFELANNIKLDLMTLSDFQVKYFIEWISTQKKEDGSPFKINYLNFFRTTIKVIVNEAILEDDLDIKVNLKKKVFKKVVEQPDDVYLTIEQINKIKLAKYDQLDEEIKQKKISERMFNLCKEIAVISASCGYRWSDLHTIDASTFVEDHGCWSFILPKQAKTGNKVIIPCYNSDVVEILDKYNFKFPWGMAEQSFNECIKIIARLAGLTNLKLQQRKDPVSLQLITTKKMVCELISHRTFRKTFASNLIREYNIPLVIAMSFSGHKTESSFRHYIRITPEEYFRLGVQQMQKQTPR